MEAHAAVILRDVAPPIGRWRDPTVSARQRGTPATEVTRVEGIVIVGREYVHQPMPGVLQQQAGAGAPGIQGYLQVVVVAHRVAYEQAGLAMVGAIDADPVTIV